MSQKTATSEKVRILDTTLRDGAQTPHVSMNFIQKYAIAKALSFVGVDVIEVGFAGNDLELDGMRRMAKLGNRDFVESDHVPIISCFTKALDSGDKNNNYIQRALDCLVNADPDRRMIHLFVGTSKELIDYRYPQKEREVIQKVKDSISYTRSLIGDHGHIEFSPEDAMRADLDFLVEVVQTSINCGANVINITDTTGFATPDNYYNNVQMLIERLTGTEDIIFSAHVHNDSGNAVATTLKGITAGIRQIEGTLLQLGERAGNTDWMTSVTNLCILRDYYNVDVSQIKTQYFYQLSKFVSEIIEQPIPLTSPVIGRNAFAESFGIHVEGVLKDQKTYFIIPPALVGQRQSIILGQTTGPDAVVEFLANNGYGFLGVDYTHEQLQELTLGIQSYCTENKHISETETKLLVEHYFQKKPLQSKIDLDDFEIKATSNHFKVKISLIMDNGQRKQGEGEDNELIPAIVNTLKDILGLGDGVFNICHIEGKYHYLADKPFEIINDIPLNSQEKIIMQELLKGKNRPSAESFVELSCNGKRYQGKGTAPNIFHSTLKAMINAVDAYYRLMLD
jgi:2-isopropylmalate synthase